MVKKYKKRNKKRKKQSPLQRGLKIGCINARGLVSSPTKRIDLFNWIRIHNLDIVCIQKWYVHKDKNVNNNYNNKNDDNIFLDWEEKYDIKDDEISLNMAIFTDYEKIELNTKTLILYHKNLKTINLNHIDKSKQEGLDSNWTAIESDKRIMVIGSIYHSPSYKAKYDEIESQINRIKRELKKKKNKLSFQLMVTLIQKIQYGDPSKLMIEVNICWNGQEAIKWVY